jgi:hypothetical protein
MSDETSSYESEAAFGALVELFGSLDRVFRTGDRAVTSEIEIVEGYRWLCSMLQVGLLTQVWADPVRPRFVDITGPYLKWGGDNSDAFYCYAPVDPARTYRVRGNRGDSVYFSLTVYGGPRDGRYSERIVGTLRDDDLSFDAEGNFEFGMGPGEAPSDASSWIRLEPDAVAAITRDYHVEGGPAGSTVTPMSLDRGRRRVTWDIEAVGIGAGAIADEPLTDAELGRRLRAVTTWLGEQTSFQPLAFGEPNTVDDPYPVPTATFGWAAGDAAYAMGRFELGPDEALVVRGRSPACRFWNLCLWNPYLHTFDYDRGRVTINGGQIALEDDGSWEIVIAAADPGRPNWVSTQGHERGLLWFRWFLPDRTPDRPTAEVVRGASGSD